MSARLIKKRTPTRPGTPLSPAPAAGNQIRINRFFTQQGVCSRREADRLIDEGRVTINRRPATLGDQVKLGDVVARDGIVVPWGNPPIYIKFHKPAGVTTTSEPHVKDNIIAFIDHPERIFPIGRLDKDSSGLILLTNDGTIVNDILRAEHRHEKEYLVRVDRPFDLEFQNRMTRGVVIRGRPTLPCLVRRIGKRDFSIILTEGRNRQIRRMCRALGYRVIALQRVRIMNITLGDLAVGRWKNLTEPEKKGLFAALGTRAHGLTSLATNAGRRRKG
jgi:23S rRNA pseudouridine2604 synthase